MMRRSTDLLNLPKLMVRAMLSDLPMLLPARNRWRAAVMQRLATEFLICCSVTPDFEQLLHQLGDTPPRTSCCLTMASGSRSGRS